jgi:hypothetical protein
MRRLCAAETAQGRVLRPATRRSAGALQPERDSAGSGASDHSNGMHRSRLYPTPDQPTWAPDRAMTVPDQSRSSAVIGSHTVQSAPERMRWFRRWTSRRSQQPAKGFDVEDVLRPPRASVS